MEVAEDGTDQVSVTVSVIDGEVVMSNDRFTLALKKGEGGLARPDKTLHGPVTINATNIIQWCLYYPGILYLEDLRMSPQERQALRDSMNAYRAGDLAGALSGVVKINANYEHHRLAARRLAEHYFAAERVLPELLDAAMS